MATKKKTKTTNRGIICPNCGGNIKSGTDKETVECSYCGVVHHISDLLNESDEVRAQRIKSDAYREVQQGWQDIEKQKSSSPNNSQRSEIAKKKFTKFSTIKTKVFSIIIVLFAILATMWLVFAQEEGYTKVSILIVIQLLLLAGCWLMNKGLVKEKKKGIRIGLFIIAVLLIFPILTNSSGLDSPGYKKQPIVWSNIVLSEQLPKPPADMGRIMSNSSKELRISIEGDSKDNFTKYVMSCREAGFDKDVVESDYDFDGYNEEGYRLHIFHYDFGSKETEIRLTAPMIFNEMSWPDSPIACLIPKPESSMLYREYEYADSLNIYVGETPYEEYNKYVSRCIEKGFSIDMYRNSRDYHGENKDKYSLTVYYEGNNIMKIQIHKKS